MARTLSKRRLPAPEAPRPAGLYSRVSRLDPRLTEEESESIASQDDECREACGLKAWPIYREYSDPGISASEYAKVQERPSWDELVADIDAGKVRAVVMWESSRGDRKPEEWIAWLNLCRRKDCLIHIMNHDEDAGGVTYNMDNPDHFDKLAREGLDNARESHKTSSRLRRVKRRRRVKGLPDGSMPYGYRRVHNRDTGKIIRQEPDPGAAPIVFEIFHRLAAQEPQLVIAKDLTKRKVPRPDGTLRPWLVSTLRNLVHRKSYISLIEFDGEEFEAQWKPVLYIEGEHQDGCVDDPTCPGCVPDDGTFNKVRALYAARKFDGSRPGRAKWELSCIAVCGQCGGVMCGRAAAERTVTRKGRRVVHRSSANYFCLEGHCGINMEWLNTHVAAVIVEYYSWPGRYDQLVKTDDAGVVAAQADLARVDAELAELYADAQAGKLSTKMAASLEQGLLRQREEAEERRVSQVSPAVRDLLDGPVEELAARWVAMTLGARRSITRSTVRVIVHPAGGRGQSRPLEERVDVLEVDED